MSDLFATADFLAALPWTAGAVVVLMLATFAVATAVGRQAVVDVAWGLGFAWVALVAFLLSRGATVAWVSYDGAPDVSSARAWLALLLTAVWGLRLATHIWSRSRGKGEDPRYEALLARATGNRTVFVLTRIYLTQGLIMWFVSLPVQVAMFAVGPPGPVAWLGVAVWSVGLFFEAVGDRQLQRFRDDPASKGQVLDTGLWRYTRHPNYFGDACVWWGIWLVAADAGPPGLSTVLSPLLMTWFLARGTGKPLLEKGMAERRPGYADYVRRTSGFFPLPPKKHA